jgi:hypothetical protein
MSCTSRTLFPRPMRRGEGPRRRAPSIATSRESKATSPRDVRTGARSAPRTRGPREGARALGVLAPTRLKVLCEDKRTPTMGSVGFGDSTETKAIGLADSGGAGQRGRFALWVLDATSWPPPRLTPRRRPNPGGSPPPSPANPIQRTRCARRCLATPLGSVGRATAMRAPGTPGSPIGHRR